MLTARAARIASEGASSDAPHQEIALAWIVNTSDGRDIRWHNGGTGGYRSFVGYDPKARLGR